MIEFLSVTLEGVGSIIERITYPLNRIGLTIVMGENGAGKTTIFNGLSWVLYNQLLKKGSSLEPWAHIQPKGYKGMNGSVTFMKDGSTYLITRTEKKLELWQDGKKSEIKGKVPIQAEIIRILGYSFDLFKSTILFGQELKRLMGEDGPTKKKILEETFDATFINKARDEVIKRNNPLKDQLIQIEAKIEAKEEIISNLEELIRDSRSQKKRFENDKAEKIHILKGKIAEIQNDIESFSDVEYAPKIKKLKKKLAGLENNLDRSVVDNEFKANFMLNAQKSVLETFQNQKKQLNEEFQNIPSICDRCQQSLPEGSRTVFIESIKKRLRDNQVGLVNKEIEVGRLEKEYKKTLEDLELYNEAMTTINRMKVRISEYEKKMAAIDKIKQFNSKLERNITELEDKIKNTEELTLRINTKEPKRKLEKLIAERDELKPEAQKLKAKIDVNSWLINDPLSNGGLKSFIFETMIKKINHQLKKYTYIVGFEIELYIDLDSARKDLQIAISNKGSKVPYEDLSGGQKQLADVALIFANNDVTTEAKPINLLLLDEVFERLSNKSIEAVSNIIQTKATHRSVHLITHKSSFNPSNSFKVEVALDENGHTHITA